jgi:hypothetical protein
LYDYVEVDFPSCQLDSPDAADGQWRYHRIRGLVFTTYVIAYAKNMQAFTMAFVSSILYARYEGEERLSNVTYLFLKF